MFFCFVSDLMFQDIGFLYFVALWKCRSSQYCAASQARLSCPPCLVILFTVLHSGVRIFLNSSHYCTKLFVLIENGVNAWLECTPFRASLYFADCIYWIPVQTRSFCKVRNFNLKLSLKKLRIQFNYIFLLWPVACLPPSGNWIEAEREINPSVSVKPVHARS